MKGRAWVLGALAGALVVAGARAETLYVIDELIVSVSSTADEGGERVAAIHSGESVEVLERRNAYSHVRLSSGTLGWVRSAYLSAALPLRRQLAAQTQELDRVNAQVAHLQGTANAARSGPPAVREPASDPPVASPDPSAPYERPLWQWALGFCLFGLIGGFALGWRMLDRRIRRKYGGLRIY